MYSAHVPADAPHLADTWSPAGFENDYPAFRSDEHGMWLRHDAGTWCISQDFVPLAFAVSEAKHPNTIHPGEWHILSHLPRGWRKEPSFGIVLPLSLAAQRSDGAVDLGDVGVDLFLRVKPPAIWYIDPETGVPTYSGTRAGGKRFCSSCRKSLSSKCFGQHLSLTHKAALPTRRLEFA